MEKATMTMASNKMLRRDFIGICNLSDIGKEQSCIHS